jgi:hypothetical protein
MDMDRGLVNRALLDVGQQPLAEEDISAGNTAYLLCKQYYLETFLEALSEIDWTGGRRRRYLMKTGIPRLENGYRFAYDMPADCARPLELRGNEYFVVEGRFICTGQDNALLLYITSGRVLRELAAVSCGRPSDIPEAEYLSGGRPGGLAEHDGILRAGRPADIPPWEGTGTRPLPEDPDTGEDYPDYRPPRYEPKFYEYIQKTLAAKFAMKISGQPQLHVQLLQEAMLIRQEAVNASMSAGAAKLKPKKWWKEELGL